MSARNPDTDYIIKGGRRIGMRHVPETCDGFSVTFMCEPRSRDCQHGSCWHMDRVRQMIHKWFTRVGPAPRLGWQPPPPKPEPRLTKEQRKEREREEKDQHERDMRWEARRMEIRSREFWRRWHERWDWLNVPDRLWRWRDTGGGSSVGDDVDGTGSWGRVVRVWENREDER